MTHEGKSGCVDPSSQSLTAFLLATVYFYALDTIPLFFAIILYVFYWPGDMIKSVSENPYPLLGIRDGP